LGSVQSFSAQPIVDFYAAIHGQFNNVFIPR